MKPIRAIVRKSTEGELVLRLPNGHEVKTCPYPEFRFGQSVLIMYDYSRGRVHEVKTEMLEEDPDSMVPPSDLFEVFEEDGVVETEDWGSVC